MKIFSDAKLSPAAAQLLREGVAPHELVRPQKMADSVLSFSEADPAMNEAEVAFGQPDVGGIGKSAALKWVQLSSAGFTRYDTAEFRALAAKHALVVTNSSSVYAEACAEHAFSFLLAQARALPAALKTHAASGTPEWLAVRSAGQSPRGQCAVILGYGAIGAHLVKLLAPFEMRLIAMRRTPRGDEGVETISEAGLPAALGQADHVFNLLPDNAASRQFIHAARLEQMKRGAVFYNIGRGTTVDQEALADAMDSGRLAAAWLDVTDPEPLPAGHRLLAQSNCHITPHTAGGHQNEDETLVRHFLQNFRRYLAGQALQDRIM
jgi:phosphoglycerate dehydrogenase-like enzyme